MIEQVSECIIQKLHSKQIISPAEINIYRYGIEQFLTKLLLSFLLIVLATPFKMGGYSILFMFLFFPIRRHAGGVHLKNSFFCSFFSSAVIVLQCYLYQFFNGDIYWIIFLLAIFWIPTILILSPVDNKNNPIPTKEFYHHRKKLIKVMILQILLLGVSFTLSIHILLYAICMCLHTIGLSVILGKLVRNRNSRFFL
ncbi:accessory gene regulator B family protein [Enterococcus casseliflavus]|uniref:accessory gene regulator B family protein n=1 Tax=Enterococcus casseliflavus TaxID=37734 RepID=UPI0034D37080